MSTIMIIELLKTLIIPSTVLTRAVVATTIPQNLVEAIKSPKRGLGRPLMIVVAILKNQHLRGPITTGSHPLNMATTGRDNSLGTIVTTMDSSVTVRAIKIVKIIRTMVTRIKIETSFDNRQYNNNGMSNSNSNFQYGQGYNSR